MKSDEVTKLATDIFEKLVSIESFSNKFIHEIENILGELNQVLDFTVKTDIEEHKLIALNHYLNICSFKIRSWKEETKSLGDALKQFQFIVVNKNVPPV